MPWCENCKTEYRKGTACCADCGASLVETPPYPMEAAGGGEQQEDWRLVAELPLHQADAALSLLEAEGIPTHRLEQGAGTFLSLYMGSGDLSGSLCLVLVPAHCLETATHCLAQAFATWQEPVEEAGGVILPQAAAWQEQEPSGPSLPSRRASRRVLLVLALVVFGLPATLLLVQVVGWLLLTLLSFFPPRP